MIISIWIHCDVCYQFDHHEMRKNDQTCHGDITNIIWYHIYNYYHIRCSHIIYHVLPYIIIYVHILSYHTWLVVQTVLKKISQLGLSLPVYIYTYIYKLKMFQTTNQILYHIVIIIPYTYPGYLFGFSTWPQRFGLGLPKLLRSPSALCSCSCFSWGTHWNGTWDKFNPKSTSQRFKKFQFTTFNRNVLCYYVLCTCLFVDFSGVVTILYLQTIYSIIIIILYNIIYTYIVYVFP